MFAIVLDEQQYIKSYSSKFRTPECFLVDSIPEENDIEKLQCYQYIDEEYVFDAEKWESIEEAREEAARIDGIKQKINNLKEMIASTDYKIIKCMEYALNDLESPYDAKELHAERQSLRDEINTLETSI